MIIYIRKLNNNTNTQCYINGIKRPYLENQRKIGMRLNEELNECKRTNCNQKPLNEVSINKS